MKLTKYAHIIKHELEIELQKQGSSLLEFEECLKNLNNGEGVLKTAVIGEGVLMEGAKSAPAALGAALQLSLAGGGLAGLSFDEMDQSVESLNKALDREREKIKLVHRVTGNLKREHGIV